MNKQAVGMFIVAGGIVAALAVFSAPASPVEAAQQCQNPYADQVVSYTPGTTHNNNLPQNALGQPEGGRNVAPAQTFASLGVGYSITLRMAENVLNGPGPDLRAYEVTFLSHIPESANVFASQDGVNFTFIGTATNAQNCDCDTNITELDLGSLAWARYVRFVDTTTAVLPGATQPTEAYDLNGVEAINCGAVATPTPTPTATPTADKPQCSDDKDNEDPEDTLADEADPGCHMDGNPKNDLSYDSEDDDERDVKKVVKAVKVTPKPVTPVKVTAKTGADLSSLFMIATGAAGLALTRRFSR